MRSSAVRRRRGDSGVPTFAWPDFDDAWVAMPEAERYGEDLEPEQELLDRLDPDHDPLPGDADGLPAGLSATETLAYLELTPIDGAWLSLLDDVDQATLDGAEQVRLARLCQRAESRFAAGKLVAVAAFAGPEPDPDAEDGIATRKGFPGFTDCEVGAALRTSTRGGQAIVDIARRLAGMPATTAALRSAELTFGHMLQLVRRVDGLSAAEIARVEELALPKAARQGVGEFGQTVRRAIARVNPEALKKKEREARNRTGVDTTTGEDGHGSVIGHGPALDVETIETWVDTFARSAKASGDTRSLDELRWAALLDGAHRYLMAPDAPTHHGRPVVVNVVMDLLTFLGLTDQPAEIHGAGAMVPAAVIRDLLDQVELRRFITDPQTGHLLDLGTSTYRLTPAQAAFLQMRDVVSTGPGSTVRARDGDYDHIEPFNHTKPEDGGRTDRANLTAVNRLWHRAKTIGGWLARRNPDGSTTWTSPAGLHHTTEPHDYRLGP
jgi:hypothetical protein